MMTEESSPNTNTIAFECEENQTVISVNKVVLLSCDTLEFKQFIILSNGISFQQSCTKQNILISVDGQLLHSSTLRFITLNSSGK